MRSGISYGVYVIAGVSSFISIIRNLIITLPYIAQILGLKWNIFYRDVYDSLLCATINALVAFAIIYIIPLYGWIGLFCKLFITVIVTFIVEATIILNKKERQVLLNTIKMKYGKNQENFTA